MIELMSDNGLMTIDENSIESIEDMSKVYTMSISSSGNKMQVQESKEDD